MLSAPSPVILPNGVYHAHEIHIHSRNMDISGLSSTISHRNSLRNLAEENNSQHPNNHGDRCTKGLSVMFDVWNSTLSVDEVGLFANTRDTAVSLIRSSTFVRLIGVSVSKSTNHLCGTSGIGLDWAGSSLLSNCSFSSCLTNTPPDPITEPTPEPGKIYELYDPDLEVNQSTRIVLSSSDNPIENLQVWVVFTVFSDMYCDDMGGSAIRMFLYQADVVVKNCSFTRCHATNYNSIGGAIFVMPNHGSPIDSKFSFTLFNCRFMNNTAKQTSGHLHVQYYNLVTVAQCTFEDSRSTPIWPFVQQYPIFIYLEGDCRLDNCSISRNEGLHCGGLWLNQASSTGKIVLTDLLFEDNICTRTTPRQRITDCVFFRDTGLSNNQFIDCFSTSAQPHCGLRDATQVFPEWIGPSITSVVATIQENAEGDGVGIVLSFEGVFTGTNRKYHVTLEDENGTEIVAENVSFSRTAGTVTFALNNPNISCISPSTTYSLVKVAKSSSGTTCNEFAVGEEEEPDWTWWHHTLESRADSMIGLSFTIPPYSVPAPPTLTNVDVSFATTSNTTFHLILDGSDLPVGDTFSELGSILNLIDGIGSRSATIKLITTASINNTLSIEAGHELKIELATVTPPTLVIPSTASLDDSTGLVSIAGTLFLERVEIDVQIGVLSFVLFDVKCGKVIMESVHISGVGSSSDVMNGIEGLCSWETGLIKQRESTCTLTSCVLSSIGMGEIWMESSNLSLLSTQILSNGAQFSSFPSAQQDVMCKSGNITILPSSSDTSEDRWISSTSDCSVVLNGTELKSPHFIPSLDTKLSRSTLSKENESFSVSIVGSKLIPCDLKLEVAESPSSKSKSNSNSVVIPLSFSSDKSWNETHINVSIPLSSLSSLSMNEEWTARIVFGKNEHTDSFTFLQPLKDRKAEALQKSLPWLIPVIVCSTLLLFALLIIVVVAVCRRRKSAKSDSSTPLSQQELSDDEVAKMEVDMQPYPTTNAVVAQNSHEPQTGITSDENMETRVDFDQDGGIQIGEPVDAIECEGQFVMKTVDGRDTLYNRIHKGDGVAEGKRREIEKKIVRGMLKMVEKPNLETGTRISPHWILLNRNDTVFIRVESEVEKNLEQDKPSLPCHTQPTVSHSGVKNGIEEIRWRAPEQGEKEGEMNEDVGKSHVMVFRLGLILWEIETGLVPFGELDAVNAHRNLAAGIALPLQKVSDASMRELFVNCLQIDADQRLTLEQALARLEEMPKGSGKEEMKDQFAKF
ncbi:hypothetical protein BLNAU_19510 [Blattamonas nauphoetae]|uniref:Protein kinase domain-containing protein n=1 Tax=Blattamonas nauphoetae TaxID=2049346 RepID=A0ABQ9X1U0_9EUKA|nr:hypothetical protein BLNAU_19510 [Blattamonas nauphoetae]